MHGLAEIYNYVCISNNSTHPEVKDGCNCRNKKYWLSGGKLLTPSVYYLGNITSSQRNCTGKVYFGVAEKLFKDYSLRLCKWYKTVERILRD